MKPYDCCLTLSFPNALEESILGYLLEHPEWVQGFSTIRVEGHGRMSKGHETAELVRGRSGRLYVQVVINREEAQALVTQLRAALPSAEVAYWLTPVIEFGRFA
jgi:hypothetical protein